MSKCIVLVPSAPYSDESEAFLRSLLAEAPDLLSVVGPYAGSWEDGVDWLCVRLEVRENTEAFCSTTAHIDDRLEDVVAFANQWCELKGWQHDVRVVRT
ncbi:hypothetical protein [Vogesella indigofera]|uniref:hypothetical protein n=1 Tax=Vogesella indigofera TaxID=45465 RepID=UPI003F43FE7A